MNGEVRGRSREPGAAAEDAVAALRQLEGLGFDEPILLAYHPTSRLNPYQALLYSRAWSHGIAAMPLYYLDDFDDVVAVAGAAGARVVLHLHWTNKVLEDSPTDAAARAALEKFVARLDRLLAAGGHLAWTVHNAIPHDARRPALEAAIQQAIVDRSTIVHVLSANTRQTVAEWFTIPEDRVLHVPHPNYIGAYADVVSPEAARWELGLPPDELVYALLGAIKPYKGLEQLVDAFDAALERGPGRRRLLVAGGPSAEPEVDAFLRRCVLHPFISLHARKVPGDEMPTFVRAADIVVLPYLRSLNSGVLMLALSFGIPVVAPAVGGIVETVTPEFARTFVPGDRESLVAALLSADELRTPEAREAALRTARHYDPARLSDEFSRGVAERVRSARPAAV